MDVRVRDYLIRAHKKVISHYRQVLQASSLSELEQMRIRQNLAAVEAELRNLEDDANTAFAKSAPRVAA